MSSRQGRDNQEKKKKESNIHLQVHYLHHHFKSFPECGYSWDEKKEGIWVSNWRKYTFIENYMIH